MALDAVRLKYDVFSAQKFRILSRILNQMSQCLDQLLSSKRSAPFVVVNGTVRFSSSLLISEFCNQALKEEQPLIVILTESCPESWLEKLQPNATGRSIHIIDAYTDPFGWDNYTATTTNDRESIQQISNLADMEHVILASVVEKLEKKEKCLIAIDSIHPLLAISQQRTYQFIKALESLTNGTNGVMFSCIAAYGFLTR